jgi:hypothetical protein
MVYVELWYDAEQDQCWKITVWYIDKLDFEPFTTDYHTLTTKIDSVHEGVRIQSRVANELRTIGYTKVHMNNYNPKTRFQIRPAWLERLISGHGETETT